MSQNAALEARAEHSVRKLTSSVLYVIDHASDADQDSFITELERIGATTTFANADAFRNAVNALTLHRDPIVKEMEFPFVLGEIKPKSVWKRRELRGNPD